MASANNIFLMDKTVPKARGRQSRLARGVPSAAVATRVARFETPARLRDAADGSAFFERWHRVVEGLIVTSTSVSGTGRYVDPSKVAIDVGLRRTSTWTGFPRPLLVQHRDDRVAVFTEGEDRAKQIEYLEWRVTRSGDAITKVTFTTETPEYWRALAEAEPDLVLARYRELVDPAVARRDLFNRGGVYDPLNRWNTTHGIVHYVMRINSMGDLLGVSQEREPSGRAQDNFDQLPYSRPTGADARINTDIWSMSRAGWCVATDDAPGPYMIDWDDTGWSARTASRSATTGGSCAGAGRGAAPGVRGAGVRGLRGQRHPHRRTADPLGRPARRAHRRRRPHDRRELSSMSERTTR